MEEMQKLFQEEEDEAKAYFNSQEPVPDSDKERELRNQENPSNLNNPLLTSWNAIVIYKSWNSKGTYKCKFCRDNLARHLCKN